MFGAVPGVPLKSMAAVNSFWLLTAFAVAARLADIAAVNLEPGFTAALAAGSLSSGTAIGGIMQGIKQAYGHLNGLCFGIGDGCFRYGSEVESCFRISQIFVVGVCRVGLSVVLNGLG